MALFATERKTFGFKKEASRGIGEAAPAKFLAVGADSEFHYSTALIADEKIRGLKERFPSVAGILSGTGNLNSIDVEAATIGDLLFGCPVVILSRLVEGAGLTNTAGTLPERFSRAG